MRLTDLVPKANYQQGVVCTNKNSRKIQMDNDRVK